MKGAIAWFIRNPVAANLLVLIIIVSGIVAVPTIKKEIFPEFSADQIAITVVYPGAAPEEVEEGICSRIEEAIYGLDGIKRIISSATENVGAVNVEILAGHDGRKLLDDIKSRVDAIDTFPKEAEKPVINEVIIRSQVINVGISGAADEASLKHVGEQVRDEISRIPGITQVDLVSTKPYEISIEVSESALRQYGLTFDEVAQAVRRSSMDVPGGSIKTSGGEILVRVKGQAYRGAEFEKIPLRTNPDGSRLILGAVARVQDTFVDEDKIARLDAEPAVMVQVFRVGDQNALEIAQKVKDYIAEAQQRMPEGITLMPWQDYSKYLQGRLDLLLADTRIGFLLVFAVLAMFLKFRLAWWVSFGIPVAFLGGIALMPLLDVSVSMISLFAFIIVLGIVVDDAIVIGENIYTHYQRGKDGITAAIVGTQEVVTPVTFGVLTTVAAFIPMLFVGGNTGKIMRVIPLIVIPTLLISLVEGLFCLPSHISHIKEGGKKRWFSGHWERIQGWFAGGLEKFVQRFYKPALYRALEHRYLAVSTAIFIFLLTIGLVGGGWIKFTFFPTVEGDDIAAFLTMPQGTPVAVTTAAIQRLEEAAKQVQKEFDARKSTTDGSSIIQHMHSAIGEQPFRIALTKHGGHVGKNFTGSELGEVHFELAPAEVRLVSGAEVSRRWRELVGSIPDAMELTYTSALMSPGEAINVQLSGPKMDVLASAAGELKDVLAGYAGIIDIADTFRPGKEELKLKIKPQAEALGLTLEDLARQVRQAFYGEEVQSIQRGREEVKVFVRYPAGERRSLENLEQMRIRTRDGQEVPFSAVAEVVHGRGFAAIKRVDRHRSVNVTAGLEEGQKNANEIAMDLRDRVLPSLMQKYPGLHYSFEGERREQMDTLDGLFRGFFITLFLIFALLAIPLKSYLQPFIVMAAIPFGIVGAIWGHVVMGLPVSVLSLFGVVALSGMVVNDSLVLVDYINNRREEVGVLQAIREAGVARFRPVILISSTTFLGLAPLILEKSVQAQFLVPMAISLGYGAMVATAVSLMIVPCLYYILEDWHQFRDRKKFRMQEPTFETAAVK